MRPGKRFGLFAIEKSDICSRWKAGESLHEIGRAFDKPHTSIRCWLLPRGGIAPAARRRSRLALTLAEREDISRGISSGSSFREIARHLDRAASTVSREVSRRGGLPVYRAHEADEHAWDSAWRPKPCFLALHPRVREMVASKLILDWSPEQISGWLKTEYPGDGSMHVSHETIYRSLFIQARGVLKKELLDLSFAKTLQGHKISSRNNVTGLSAWYSFQRHSGFWRTTPEASPGRPTVSTPATLGGFLQGLRFITSNNDLASPVKQKIEAL